MKKVSFCGISGSGMSALAQVLQSEGYDVKGSDRSFDQGKDQENKKALESIGIKIYPQDGSAVSDDLDCLFVSTAVEDSIPDVKAALDKHIPIRKRSDLLAEIFNTHKYGVAVGGTSGKTTVTAMIGFVLDKLGKKPLVINGGLLKNYADAPGIPNVILNSGDICVVEADESDGSIEKYNPYVAVVSNVALDHKSLEDLQKLFADFTARADGGAVINLDCPNSAMLLNKNPHVITFSTIHQNADVYAGNIKPVADGVVYEMKGKKFTLKIPGRFNVSNALAAFAACRFLGVDELSAAKVLEEFAGTKRRLDVIGSQNNVTVIDDFAHNPSKVAASMSALRDYDGRLLIMFQPHGFSPMRMMGKEIIQSFAQAMSPDDRLFIPEIYYAGGTVRKDISSADLVDYAVSLGVKAEFYQTREEIKTRMRELAKSGDRIVVMGARDNSLPDFCRQILEELKK